MCPYGFHLVALDAMNDCTLEAPEKPPLRRRIGCSLFPARWPETPSLCVPKADMIMTRTYWEPSIVDRLRLLVSGRLVVETRTATEHEPGQTASAAEVNVQPPLFLT